MSFLKFEDIRMILSIQGYQLNHQFIIREIGFWSPRISGVIPFNCKLNMVNVDSFSTKNIFIAENKIHGIKLKSRFENALPNSEASSVLRTLYHITKNEDYAADYIGILKDENISSVVFKSGLGKYVIELDQLDIITKSQSNLPTLHDFKFIIGTELNKYKPCYIHDMLRNNDIGVCSRVKVEIIANHFKQLKKQQEQEQSSMSSIYPSIGSTSSIQQQQHAQQQYPTGELLLNLLSQQMSSSTATNSNNK